MKLFETGDPCPCCGQPIRLTDPAALLRMSVVADLLGLGRYFPEEEGAHEQESDLA